MKIALRVAKWGGEKNEIPVGAVIYDTSHKIVSLSHNKVEKNKDVIAHAEILAIRRATSRLKTKYLTNHCLVTTLEPCAMCTAVIREARIPVLVFGAQDKKGGAVLNTCRLYDHKSIRPAPIVIHSIMEGECGDIIKDFFVKLRQAKK